VKAVLRVYDRLLAGLALLSAFAFGAVAFIIAYEVTMRWLGLRPPVWPQAISEFTMLYATLFGAPWILRVTLTAQGLEIRSFEMPKWLVYAPLPLGFLLLAIEFLRHTLASTLFAGEELDYYSRRREA
jgi:TRAP-type C4-dicarboxylate transport system permease small subunit